MMRLPGRKMMAGWLALPLVCGTAVAQEYLGPVVGSPVDRNVADTGANAASQRLAQPGIGQFGVGSLLLDRYADRPGEAGRVDRTAADPRISQRFLLQAPGFTAITDRPDYIGPSPQGGWVRNAQTYDGAEIMTLTGANTVFVLSPELLRTPLPREQRAPDHPNRLQLNAYDNPDAYMRNLRVTGEQRKSYGALFPQRVPAHHFESDPNYVHPEIIERRRKLKAEREAEQREQAADDSDAGHKAAQEEQKEDK